MMTGWFWWFLCLCGVQNIFASLFICILIKYNNPPFAIQQYNPTIYNDNTPTELYVYELFSLDMRLNIIALFTTYLRLKSVRIPFKRKKNTFGFYIKETYRESYSHHIHTRIYAVCLESKP